METTTGSWQPTASQVGLEEPADEVRLEEFTGNGLLPLATALYLATEIATELRELHGEGRAHGEVGADHVLVSPHGARLLSPAAPPRRADQRSDIVAFGALTYELVTGSKPPRDLSDVAVAAGPRTGPEGIRAAAVRLALRCLGAASDPAPHMQQALMEMRLYSVIARQLGWRPAGGARLRHFATKPEEAEEPRAAQPCALETCPTSGLERYLIPADEVPPPLPPSDIKCRKCSGFSVYRSKPRTIFERLVNVIGVRLYRCHRCTDRYLAVVGMKVAKRAKLFCG